MLNFYVYCERAYRQLGGWRGGGRGREDGRVQPRQEQQANRYPERPVAALLGDRRELQGFQLGPDEEWGGP